ncbi:MAG: DnaD domain protein [Clostridia bacterium]|nr:DnaD domain protein [Clostridia bacterium]
MKIEVKEDFGLFSSTDIPDIFFADYLGLASGDAVKVYLYLSFLSKNGKDINVSEVSKILSLSYETVNQSIKYWEEQGLLIKKPDGYLLANLKEIALSKLYSPKVTSSPENIEKSEKTKKRTICIEGINNQFFSGMMNPTWYTDIDLWFEKYGFDEQVMVMLFSYCVEKTNNVNRNYIQAVAERLVKK